MTGWGNLSGSFMRLAQADSSSPDRPSSRRADHNNSNCESGCRLVQTLGFSLVSQAAKIAERTQEVKRLTFHPYGFGLRALTILTLLKLFTPA